MKILSLRFKLTLIVTLLLTLACVCLTALSLHNADKLFIGTMSPTDSYPESFIASSNESPQEILENFEGDMVAFKEANFSSFSELSFLLMVFVIIGGGFLSWFLLGKALRSLKTLNSEINTITEQELFLRIKQPKAKDEVRNLADSFNTLLARLEKAFSEQRRFSSDAAHELRTPLTIVKTNLEVLEAEEKPSIQDYQEVFTVVKKQNERMSHLVENLFSLAAYNSYDVSEEVMIQPLLRGIVEQLEPLFEDKNIVLTTKIPSIKVVGNSTMLRSVFINLIENAYKYTAQGGSINISVHESEESYVFEIADTGIGIPENKIQDIFKAFYRADESRSRKIAGAGLGLAITKSIIERHGGDIKVSSTEGEGTCFMIVLPRLTINLQA